MIGERFIHTHTNIYIHIYTQTHIDTNIYIKSQTRALNKEGEKNTVWVCAVKQKRITWDVGSDEDGSTGWYALMWVSHLRKEKHPATERKWTRNDGSLCQQSAHNLTLHRCKNCTITFQLMPVVRLQLCLYINIWSKWNVFVIEFWLEISVKCRVAQRSMLHRASLFSTLLTILIKSLFIMVNNAYS